MEVQRDIDIILMNTLPTIVDAHLDLAYNALNGRDVTLPAGKQTADKDGIPSVGLPDLYDGNVKLICGTIFCEPASADHSGYRSSDEAHTMLQQQVAWYAKQQHAGRIELITRRQQIKDLQTQLLKVPQTISSAQKMILLLEGADPIRTPDDIPQLVEMGIRVVGLAWRGTRYAGGTGEPGPLTGEGAELILLLDKARLIHDVSHLAEESFWQLLELTQNRIIASHSNCRSIVPTDRQLSDDMIRAILRRDGVIGINLFDRFLLIPDEQGKRQATLADVVHHIKHVCDLAGDTAHVGIGSDMDGGFGRNEIPQEIATSADLYKIGEALNQNGFSDTDVKAILGGNWLRFFEDALPA